MSLVVLMASCTKDALKSNSSTGSSAYQLNKSDIVPIKTSAISASFVDLKTAGRFGIIAGVAVSNNAGFSQINDLDVGIYPGGRSSVTGFPPAIITNGAIYAASDLAPAGVPAMLMQAKQDLNDAYLFAQSALSPVPATVAGDQGGKTLAPGVYKSTSTL